MPVQATAIIGILDHAHHCQRCQFAYPSGGGRARRATFRPRAAAVAASRPVPLEITPEGTRYIDFEDWRRTGIALALGFIVGAVFVSLSTRGESR